VGPSNAKTITDHLAVLRPHCWLMIGHCGGLRQGQTIGDYVLAHGYLRRDRILDDLVPPEGPILLLTVMTAQRLSVGAADAGQPMSVDDFLLDMKQLDERIVAVRGEALCDGPDLCVLYNGPWKSFAFDTTGLLREDRRKLLDYCVNYRCPITVIGRARAGPTIAPNLIAQQVEW
jgi:hypothetical protein